MAYSKYKKKGNLMHKRWYDIDPTVSLSVSLIRNASETTQKQCADYIIDYAKQRNLGLKDKSLNNAFNYILRRWYDKDEHMSEAFEYYEKLPMDLQWEVALEVINILQFA